MRPDQCIARFVALACGTLIAVACGSSSDTTGPGAGSGCAVSVSGPTTISNAGCTGPLGPAYDPVAGNSTFTLNATLPNGYTLAYLTIIQGPLTANATYVVAPSVISASMSFTSGGLATWKGTVSEFASEDVGTISLTLTSVSSTTQTSGLVSYQLHGTINASLPTLQGSGATGTATVKVDF